MRNFRAHTVRLVACFVLAIGAGTFLGCGDDDERQFGCTTDEQCLDNEACIGEVCVDAPQEGDSCPDEHEGEESEDLVCEDGTWVEAEIDGPQIHSVEVTPERAIPYTIQEVVVDAEHPEGQQLVYHWELPEGWQEAGDLDDEAIEMRAPDEYGESGEVEVTVVDEVGQEISATTEVSTEELFCGGEGTESQPWDVCSAKFVNRIGVYEGVKGDYFELTEDVDMEDLDGEQFYVIGDDDEPFAGVFDGGGHVIENLTVDEEGDETGLFGRVDDGAEIRDLTLDDFDVTGADQVGGVAGRNEGLIYGVQITGYVSGEQDVGGLVGENRGLIRRSGSDTDLEGDSHVGGLVGRNIEDIEEATAHGDVEGNDDIVGGLVGRNAGDITDSYATGDVEGDDEVGGLVGANSSTGTIENTYATGSVLSSSNLGGLVASNAAASEDIAYSFWDVDTSGIPDSDGGEPLETGEFQYRRHFSENWTFYPDDEFVWVMQQDAGGDLRPSLGWEMPCGDDEPSCETGVCDEEVEVCVSCNVNADDEFGGGDGSADTPWRVCSESHLEMMADEDYLDAYFQQYDDVEMTSSWEDYDAIGFVGDGDFEGQFDGGGYWIEDFEVDTEGSRAGLFGTIGIDGEVSNVMLVDVDVEAENDQVGALAGVNEGTITASSVTGTVSGKDQVGALVGRNGGTIEDSVADAQVDGDYQVGGLVGFNDGDVGENSHASTTVNGDHTVGGLIGHNWGAVSEAHATGTVSGEEDVGGLIGNHEEAGSVSEAYATGTVTG